MWHFASRVGKNLPPTEEDNVCMSRIDQQHSLNRIALVNLQGELCTCTPAGDDLRTVSSPGRWYQFPAWSPDGSRLAAIGGTRTSAGVYVFKDSVLSEIAAIHANRALPPMYLSWSRNSQWLTFLTVDQTQDSMALFLAHPFNEGTPKRITRGRPCFWDWSPDSRHILMHSGFAGDEGRLLYLGVNDDGSTRVVQNNVARPGLFQSPGISPSGKFWAFGDLGDEGELRVVIDGGTKFQPMVALHKGVAAMSWSPSGDQLAFISPEEQAQHCYGELRTVDAATGNARVLTEQTVLAFFWSPDGKRIAYFTVAAAPSSFGEMLGLNQPDLKDMGGTFKPGNIDDLLNQPKQTADRRKLTLTVWVIDVETNERTLLGLFEPLELFINQFLPFFDQYALSHRIWSPTSDALVIPTLQEDGAGNHTPRITVFPLANTKPVHIAHGVSAFWSWQ